MKSTLRQIRQDVAGIAKAANQLNIGIKDFAGDANLQGEAFQSARDHFNETYYAALLLTISTCDQLKICVENLMGKLDRSFTIDRNKMDEDKLSKQRDRFKELADGYHNRAKDEKDPELKDYYERLYNSTMRTVEKYDKTIQEMHDRNAATADAFNAADAAIQKLKEVIRGIDSGYDIKKGKLEFTNTIAVKGKYISPTDIKKALKSTYSNPYVMKEKFDPVNMSTGCYIYDKSFLKTEGIKPLSFEIRYSSTNPNDHGLSRGWGHNHDISLEETKSKIKLSLRSERTEEYLKKGNEIVNADGFASRKFERADDAGYIYTDEDGNKYHFNAEGECIRIIDREGLSICYGYEDDKLSSVDTDFGIGYRLKYEDDRLIEASDLAGRKVQFKYEESRLISIVDECGEEYKYEYDDYSRMHKVVNARGTVNLVNTYDGLGRVLKQEFPDEGETRFEYLEEKKTIKVAAQDGSVSEYEHDEKHRSTEERYRKGSEKYSYDAANNKVSEIDRNGNEIKYEYDEHGNCTAEVTALGDRYEYEYDEEGRETKVSLNGEVLGIFEYNENGRLVSKADALGRETRAEYTENNLLKKLTLEDGSVIYYEHDAQGNISKLVDENGNEQRYTYDKLNRVTESVDANGKKEMFEYNARSEITKMTNAAGDSRVYEYNQSGKLIHAVDFDGNEEFAEYNELNKISKYTDKDGNDTFFEYDKMWNLSKTVDAEGGVRLFAYDGDGRLLSETDANFNTKEYSRDGNGNVIRETDEDGNYTKFEYDALNRVTRVIYKDGTEEQIEYDALGNETKFIDAAGNEWQSKYNLAGELTGRINPEGLETVYEYDLRGRLIKEQTESLVTIYEYDKSGNLIKSTYPDGTEESYSYDANGNMTGRIIGGVHFSFCYDCLDRLTEVKREGQTVKSFEYDKVGNRIAVTDALGNTTRYVRSKAGDILTAVDPLGHETHYSYDKCHRLIGIDQGEGRVTTYTRDKASNVLAVTDALGNTESYEYDCNNNVIAKTDMDGNRTTIKRNIYGDVAKIKYADSTEVEYSYDSLRRLKEVKDSLGITRIERDTLGRETKVTDHKGRAVSYSYDKLGNRTGIRYPSGKQVAYEYDALNRNTKIKTDDVEASMTYDALGRLRERVSNSLLTSYAYDNLGRLSELTHRQNEEIIYSEHLSFDADDNILSDGHSSYEYDELGRLTKAAETGGNTREYSYDVYGNRVSLKENGTVVTYLYDEANQLLSTSDGLSFKYDRRGNVIERSQNGEILNTYIYGANNRLERAMNAKGDTASYKYNGLGRRVSRIAGNTEVDYLLDQTKMYNNLLEADGEEYIWDENNLLFRNAEAQIRDRLGSPLGMEEFGAVTTASTLGFTGYMYDDISDTYFAQAREYMPEVGRFAGRDIVKGTILEPLTLNNYHYCYSNSMRYLDYDGRIATMIGPFRLWPSIEEHYNRNDEQDRYIEKRKKELGGEAAFIQEVQDPQNGWVRASSDDNQCHQYTFGEQGMEAVYNVKYTKRKADGIGSYEVIICDFPKNDEKGRNDYIVTDPVNIGTANESDPIKQNDEPEDWSFFKRKFIDHGRRDFIPYVLYGNTGFENSWLPLQARKKYEEVFDASLK